METIDINTTKRGYQAFKKKIKKTYSKGEVVTRNRIARDTGVNYNYVDRYTDRMAKEHHLKEVKAFMLGCPKDKLVLFSSIIGNLALCGHCDRELPYPSDYVETVTCPFCGTVYPNEQWHVAEKDVLTFLTEINYCANKTLLEDIRVIVEGIPTVVGSWFTWLQSELGQTSLWNLRPVANVEKAGR